MSTSLSCLELINFISRLVHWSHLSPVNCRYQANLLIYQIVLKLKFHIKWPVIYSPNVYNTRNIYIYWYFPLCHWMIGTFCAFILVFIIYVLCIYFSVILFRFWCSILCSIFDVFVSAPVWFQIVVSIFFICMSSVFTHILLTPLTKFCFKLISTKIYLYSMM